MALKCMRSAAVMLRRFSAPQLLVPKKGSGNIFFPQIQNTRGSIKTHFIPPDQYDTPGSPKFKFPQVMFKYVELIPLFGCTAVAIGGVIFNVIWACFHKVDVVFKTHSRKNLSRTMNLCAPEVHKLITINQEYKPWPQMARVLNMMKEKQCENMMLRELAKYK